MLLGALYACNAAHAPSPAGSSNASPWLPLLALNEYCHTDTDWLLSILTMRVTLSGQSKHVQAMRTTSCPVAMNRSQHSGVQVHCNQQSVSNEQNPTTVVPALGQTRITKRNIRKTGQSRHTPHGHEVYTKATANEYPLR